LGTLGGKVGVEYHPHDLFGYASAVVGDGYHGRVPLAECGNDDFRSGYPLSARMSLALITILSSTWADFSLEIPARRRAAVEMLLFLEAWITNHLLKTDAEFGKFLRRIAP
jgi:hypothetical protein